MSPYDSHPPQYEALWTSDSSLPALHCMLGGLTWSDYACLTPALSWLYPAHTGQVTSFPGARWNLEASEANGTVSQYSVRLTRPWLTGACLSSRGPPSLSKLNPNCLLPNTCSPIKTTQTCVCTQLATDGLIPIGKLGEGNSASILKGNRMLDCSREINWFILPVFEPMWNVEFPLFLFFPIVMSVPVRWLLTTCFRLLQECLSMKQENTQTYILVFLSEAVRTLNLLHTYFRCY